jgi:hypothetical protein
MSEYEYTEYKEGYILPKPKVTPTDFHLSDNAAQKSFMEVASNNGKKQVDLRDYSNPNVQEYDARLIAALSDESPARMPKDIPGLSLIMWRRAISAAAIIYNRGLPVTIDSILEAQPWIPRETLAKLFAHREWARALRDRGVGADFMGLNERQMMALAHMTNFTDKRSEAAKLRSLGIESWEFQTWLSGNAEFARLYREASERLFKEAQAAVNIALVNESTKGNVGAIKYFNQLSGRYDPNSVNTMNVQQVLQAVVEILSEELRDKPDLLRTIGGRLALVAGSSGSFTAAQIDPN